MFKKWLKEFFIVCICFLIIFTPVLNVFASDGSDYIKNDDDEDTGVAYYIVEGKDVDDLFNFTLADALSGDKAVKWALTFKTFTVIKHNEDEDTYYCYFNTPSLQSVLKNRIIANISDGYQGGTYNINDTQWFVKVGDEATNENAITKYGFKIANPTYMGEYPKADMSIAGVVPSGFWSGLWRAFKSLFGYSFLSTPDADNFNTITYYNHGYNDSSQLVVDFFKKYYRPYFDKKIQAGDFTYDGSTYSYFNGPEEVISQRVTSQENDDAKSWNEENQDDVDKAKEKLAVYNDPASVGYTKLGKYLDKNSPYLTELKTWYMNHQALVKTLYASSDVLNQFTDPAAWTGAFADFPTSADVDWSEGQINKVLTALETYDLDSPNLYVGNSTNTSASNYEISTYKDAIDNNTAFSYVHYRSALGSTNCSTKTDFNSRDTYKPSTYTFKEEDFLTPEEKAKIDTYDDNLVTQKDYTSFTDKMDNGQPLEIIKTPKQDKLFYNQCLIENQGKDEECWSKKYGDKTTYDITSVYALSGLYKITENYKPYEEELSDADAYKILNKLQTYCGPYYSEVVSNMIKLMALSAYASGDSEPMQNVSRDDDRIMPYDVDTLTSADKLNYSVSDPRVEIYKGHIVGGLVSDLTINWGIAIFFKPTSLIDLGGRITEISVFFQQLCDFQFFEDYDLSPTNMWKADSQGNTNAYVLLLMSFLALFFVIQTITSIIKMGTNSAGRLFVAFLLLVFELGMITAIAIAPDRIWNTIKNAESNIINLGESATIHTNELDYLYGSASDEEVTYYMPYLDLWSKYNTGYGIIEYVDDGNGGTRVPQLINTDTDKPELKGLYDYDNDEWKDYMPKIDGNNIQHYSVLLADAFTYHGDSNSVVNGVYENGKVCNGTVINNNAYRVVDHFLAPRVTIERADAETLNLSTAKNENYNGDFQGNSVNAIINLLVKLLNCILLCFISIIKFLTFVWQWWVLYIFIFRVILGKFNEQEPMSEILLKTFSPILFVLFIGIYAGIVLQVGMLAEGLMGIFLEIFLFILTAKLIVFWHGLRSGTLFPQTLKPVYILCNLGEFLRGRRSDRMGREANQNAKDEGIEFTNEEIYNLDKRTDRLFNEDGTFKEDANTASNTYKDWYKFAKNEEKNGKELDKRTRDAMRRMESDNRFEDFTGSYNNNSKIKSSKSENTNNPDTSTKKSKPTTKSSSSNTKINT